MKSLLLGLALLVASATAFGRTVNLDCVRTSEGNLLEEKRLNVSVSESELQFKANFFGTVKTVKGKFSGTARTGSLIYDGSDLTGLIDQADMGNVFVDRQILAGRPGNIGLSVRQLGDSEGFSWINEKFKCKAQR